MPYLAIIGGLILVAIIAFLAFVASRPGAFKIERTATVHAPPAVVFPLISDLHRWPEWSPFEKLDSTMKRTYDGPAAGAGAVTAWSGNSKAGEGKMTVTEAKPDQLVRMDLDFTRPFKANNKVTFTITPNPAGSEVTWSMTGEHNLFGKVFSMMCNMDKMVGKEFAEGLGNLDRIASRRA